MNRSSLSRNLIEDERVELQAEVMVEAKTTVEACAWS